MSEFEKANGRMRASKTDRARSAMSSRRDWARAADIADGTGLSCKQLARQLRILRNRGEVEHLPRGPSGTDQSGSWRATPEMFRVLMASD